MQVKDKKNTEISDRISLMLNSLNVKPNSFAQSLGYKRSQTIYDIINGKSAPSFDFFNKMAISEYSEIINMDWLLTGRGNIFNTKSTENVVKHNDYINDHKNDHKRKVQKTWSNEDEIILKTKSTENVINSNDTLNDTFFDTKRKVQETLSNDEATIYDPNKPTSSITSDFHSACTTLGSTDLAIPSQHGIPLIPFDAAAGYMSGDGVQVMEYECEHYIVPTFKGAEFLIRITGMSMYPKYASGDIVACARLPLDTFFQWNKVYVVDSQQGILIKRIKQGRDDAHISLVSENKEFEPFELHRNELNSIALVIGLIRLE